MGVLVIVEWIVGPKSVSIDGQRFLLEIVEKESHGRFVGGFRRDDVSLTAAAITEREHWRSVPFIRSPSAFREGTRARLSVALAAFQSGRDVELVDLDRANDGDSWRVERSGELFDAPAERAIRNANSASNWRLLVLNGRNKGERNQELAEADPRMRKNRVGPVVERAVAIHRYR